MAGGTLAVNVITPKGVLAKVQTDALTAPGELGEFEVLPGHVPMLAALRPGRLVIGEKAPERFAVSGGYLRIDAGGAIEILVEQAVRGADVKVDAVREQLKAAEATLAQRAATVMDADFKTAQYAVEWARAQLAASGTLV